ncbi:MAG: bifunctional precorrin-2 dehydrogenase/sirohydrochlorin ferrochelatase [Deltaproteobacteria bacterium]|nr:bifunctional precorrin-2 dehydrogenase/sirohydrochlorin ferrochelatase [Deltaproteobacteria bacterium]
MRTFPVNLDLRGRRCVVVGGGPVAQRKVTALLRCGAAVRVISPRLTPRLGRWASAGRIGWTPRPLRRGDLRGATLVFGATDDARTNQRLAAEARRAGILVNVADTPGCCDFFMPAVVRRGELVVGISTGGNSPALARRLREELGRSLGPEYRLLVRLLGRARTRVLAVRQGPRANRALFTGLVRSPLLDEIRAARWQEVDRLLARHVGDGVTLASLGFRIPEGDSRAGSGTGRA